VVYNKLKAAPTKFLLKCPGQVTPYAVGLIWFELAQSLVCKPSDLQARDANKLRQNAPTQSTEMHEEKI
jgi:hypothetical protein